MAQVNTLLKDGGIGTTLLSLEAHPVPALHCTDLLNINHPELVIEMHQQFLNAGSQLITSNTFCCDPDSLKDSAYKHKLQKLSQVGAQLARQVASPHTQVLGSLGPGWKSPSKQEINFSTLESIYYERSLGLLIGAVDILWIETVQDPKQAEAAVSGALKAQQKLNINRPIAVLITCSADGTQTGPYTSRDVLKELEELPIEILGVNCSFRPNSLYAPLSWLREHSTKKIAACPNAGMPKDLLSPADFTQEMCTLWLDFQPDILGGCCSVSPEHIQMLNQALLKENL